MAKINDNYLKLKAGYLFPEIGRRVRAFAEANPQAKVIRLGIGDVTRPLPPAILKAFHDAVDDLAPGRDLRRLRPGAGVRLADQRHHREVLQAARRVAQDRGDVHLRRLQVRLRQHPRHLRPRQRGRHRRPGLPGLQRHQRHDRPHRRGGREGLLQGDRLHALHRGERLHPGAPDGEGGHHLPLLPQQPDRRGGDQGRAARSGSTTPTPTTPSSSSTPPTRRSSPTRLSPTPSTRSKGRRSAPSSSAPSPRPPASPACAAAWWSSRKK